MLYSYKIIFSIFLTFSFQYIICVMFSRQRQITPEKVNMIAKIYSFIRDETGATAIEYGLIAALISVAAIAAMDAMGG